MLTSIIAGVCLYWPREGFAGRLLQRQRRVSWRGLSFSMQPTCWRRTCDTVRGRVGHDGASHDKNEPLYSTLDALNCLDYFGRTAAYLQVLEVAAGVHATFIDAGHILGSASIFLELEEQ